MASKVGEAALVVVVESVHITLIIKLLLIRRLHHLLPTTINIINTINKLARQKLVHTVAMLDRHYVVLVHGLGAPMIEEMGVWVLLVL